jgi:predicted alpha/beta superfamily hydrolase
MLLKLLELFMGKTHTKQAPKTRRNWLILWTIAILFTNLACGALLDGRNSTDVNVHPTAVNGNPAQSENNPSKIDDPIIVETTVSGKIEVFSITIPQLNNRERTIQVYLPPDYDTSDKRYPVIYLLDGEFLFNPPREDQGDYAIDETLDRLFVEEKIEGMIAVGIGYDNQYRWDEYSPWINHNMHDWVKPANSEPIEGGEGFEFLAFIVNTLKPEIDTRYRTRPDRENSAIGGFCRTALIPVVAGLSHPEIFSQVFSMSPTVWLAEDGGYWLSNNQLINYINTITVPDSVRFFIHVGTDESSGNRPHIEDQYGKRISYPQAYVEGVQILTSTLIDNGVPESNVHLEIIEGSTGGRDLWASRFDDALLWLIGPANN